MSEVYILGLVWLCLFFLFLALWIYANSKERVDMSRLERLHKLKKYYLHNLIEDPIDGTGFDLDVLNGFEFLEKRYKDE